MDENLRSLIGLSNSLGESGRGFAILGEGNTSARADGDTFWVKASGTSLCTIDEAGFVRVSFEPVLSMLDGPDLTNEEIDQGLVEAKVDPMTGSKPAPDDGVRPSVETVLHAICLSIEGINFVGHTHPATVNALTCSSVFETAVSGRLFPDEIVVCGPAPAVVPYTNPGLPLARGVRDSIHQYVEEWHELPRIILMQNHGMIALGETARQVENITAMEVKAARVLIGTYQVGGWRFALDPYPSDGASYIDAVDEIVRLTEGRGVDVAFEATGADETPDTRGPSAWCRMDWQTWSPWLLICSPWCALPRPST